MTNMLSISPKLARRLLWSLLAIAIAVCVVIFMPRSEKERDAETSSAGVAIPMAPEPMRATEIAAEPPPPQRPALDAHAEKFRAQHELARYRDDIEPQVRIHWSDILREMKDVSWAPAVHERLLPEPDAEVKTSLARTLGVFGTKEAVSLLLQGLSAAEPAHRVWYREALCRLEHRPSCHKLRRLTRQRDLAVAFAATLALADLSQPGDRYAIGALTKLARREVELTQFDGVAGISILTRLSRLGHRRARAELIDLLGHEDEQVRLAAAKGMAWIGDDGGKEVLLSMFNSGQSHQGHRLDAAVALVWLGEYAGHSYLQACLADDSPSVRMASARALGTIGDRESVRVLRPLYRDDDRRVRISAAAAVLFILGLDPRLLAQDSVDWVMTALRSEDWRIRQKAAAPLRYLEHEQAVALLAQGVVDPEPQVRVRFVQEAAHLGPAGAVVVAEALRFETDAVVQEAQIAIVAQYKEPAAKETLEALASKSDRVGVLALGALIAVGETSGLSRLADVFAKGKREARLAGVQAAVIADERGVLPLLEKALNDAVAAVRLAAAEALAGYGVVSERVVGMLENALDKAPAVAEGALAALLAAGIVPDVSQAAQKLGEADDQSGDSDIAAFLDSANEEVRNAVFRAVSKSSWQEAQPVLREAMRHPNPTVRQSATDVLSAFAESHRKEVIPMLKMAVKDDDAVTRVKSKALLSRHLPKVRRLPKVESAVEPAAELARELEVVPAAGASAESALEGMGAGDSESEGKIDPLAELERERLAFEKIASDIENRLGELQALTSARARHEKDVEDVEALRAQVRAAQKQLLAARGRVGMAAASASLAAGSADEGDDNGAAELAQRYGKETKDMLAKSSDRAKDAIAEAGKWLEVEKADCPYYLSAAESALALDELAVARRDLQRAEKVCRHVAEDRGRVEYAWARFYDRQADRAKNDGQLRRALKRARGRYQRFIDNHGGTGSANVRVEGARVRIVEIDEELSGLGE